LPSTTRHARLAATVAALAIGTTPLLFAVGADAAAPTTAAPRLAEGGRGPIKVDLLAINDFHGQLEKVESGSSSNVPTGADPDGSGGPQVAPSVLAGGAAYLGWHLGALRADAADRGAKTLTVAAGDLIGATPLLSAAFHDEPTVETMNKLGLDITSVGNHEFDEGWRELVRMQNGGCKADDGDNDLDPYQDSCPGGKSFEGADYQYLSANVIRTRTGKTVFPAYQIKRVGRASGKPVKMAFVGMTLEDTPNVVTAAGVKGLEFIDEVQAVKNVLPELRKQGVKSIVVLLHEGGTPAVNYEYNGCNSVTGAGAEIARTLPAAVDVVVSGHTHQAYNCTVQDPQGNDRLFTSAFSLGRIVTDIALEIDRGTGDVVRPTMKAENHIVTNSGPGVRPRAGIVDLIARYAELVAPIADQVLGKIAPADEQNSLSKPGSSTPIVEDFELGNLIADSQLAFSKAVPAGGETPDVALMNPGGIRTTLLENSEGNVTYGAAFAVQPFNNFVSSITLTGQQLLDVLNEQWNGRNEARNNILQIAGFEYTYDKTLAGQPATPAVVAGDVLIDTDHNGEPETPLDLTAEYRVVANNFLADGGDGFPTLAQGTERFVGGLDIDALTELLAGAAYAPPATDRITVRNP
jgi:5'-nucleotidase